MPGRINDDERLRRLEAVTDATLSRLDASDLLDELLDRVRDLLDVDTAVILLLDAHSQHLVATAAKGLEEEVRAGFRVAVGRGFAGRIAAARAAVRLTDVTPADVVNPLLTAKGIRSLLGVPIVAGRDLVGVLHVGTLRRREFADDDVKLLELVADRAAVAGRIRSAKLDQSAALALQRSLLPALYAMISPDRGRAVISTAGHLRPVLAGPDGTAALAGVPVDRLVATVRADAPEVVCATVMSDAADAPPTDDVAVLAVRATDDGRCVTVRWRVRFRTPVPTEILL